MEGLAEGRTPKEMTVGGSRATLMVVGAREENRAGGAWWGPRTQTEQRPTAESKKEGAMVETWVPEH